MSVGYHVERQREIYAVVAIAVMLTLIVLAVIAAVAFYELPDWCEALFSAIAGGAVVKLADCLNAIVALSLGRANEGLGASLARSGPALDPAPQDAAEGADQAADAAQRRADEIAARAQSSEERQ